MPFSSVINVWCMGSRGACNSCLSARGSVPLGVLHGFDFPHLQCAFDTESIAMTHGAVFAMATRVTSFAPGFDRVRDSSALIRRVYKAVIRDYDVLDSPFSFRPSCGLGRRMQSSRLSFTKATMMLWRCTSAFRGVKFSYLWKIISSFYYFGRTHVFIFQCRAENVWVSHSPSQSPFVNLHAHGGCDQYRTFINEAPTVSFYGPHRLQVSSLRFPL